MIDRARQDIAKILRGSFSVEMRLIAPNGEEATIQGLHNKIRHYVDANTLMSVNAQKATATFCEADLVSANSNYPIRDSEDEVTLKNHQLLVADSTGNERHYMIEEFHPDETVGAITVILSKYVPDAD